MNNPPESGRLATTTLIILAAISPIMVWLNPAFIPLRVVIVLPTIFFSPGYLMLKTLFKEKFELSERLLLSIGISLSITGVWAVIISELLLPITPLLVGAPLVTLTLIFGALDLWKGNPNS